VQPLIIALGRSDNHALLAPHARSLGVEYLGFEGFEASEFLRDPNSLRNRLKDSIHSPSPIIAAIDSSISATTLRSFAMLLERELHLSPALRTEPGLLEDALSRSDGISPERDQLLALTIARSPHGQIATWPLLRLNRDGSALPITQDSRADDEWDSPISNLVSNVVWDLVSNLVSQVTSSLSTQASSKGNSTTGVPGLVGLMTFVIDPVSSEVIKNEFGLASITFWSESASYTGASEQLIRAILDLPLGDTRLIDFEEFYLREEVDLPEGVIADPIRPFLHLFARNPRMKVSYLELPEQERSWARCLITLFASTQQEALIEMAHARDFMRGLDE